MLVAALGVAFIAPHMMAARFLNMVDIAASEDGGVAEVQFAGLGDETSSLSKVDVAQSRLATARLAGVLDEITREGNLTPRRLHTDAEAI